MNRGKPAASEKPQRKTWGRQFSRRSVFSVVTALLLMTVAVFGLATHRFSSSRATVAAALKGLFGPQDAELRLVLDVRQKPDPSGKKYHHLQLRAGPGPLLWPEGGFAGFNIPFRIILERKGMTLFVRGTTLLRDGAAYLRLTELPPLGRVSRVLEERWLQVREKRERPSRELTPEEQTAVFRALATRDVLREVQRGKSEPVRGIRARTYRLQVDDERLAAVLRELPQQIPDHAGLAGVSHAIASRLTEYRTDLIQLWIRPQSQGVLRARIELVPRAAASRTERLILDVTLLPRAGGDVPAAPTDAIRLQPEVLQKLFGS